MICGEIAGWDGQDRFTERSANAGSLGVFDAKYLIRYLQANARRLDKFGA
jgi:2,3-bisphosphoglycerate-independent phosphoglycerate mutase